MFGTMWASVVFQFLVHFKISNVCTLEIDEFETDDMPLRYSAERFGRPQRNSEMKILILLYN